jgi:hypothetical protein
MIETRNQPQQCRLATTRRAKQRKEVTGFDAQSDRTQGFDAARKAAAD